MNIFQNVLDSSLPKLISEPYHLHAQAVEAPFFD